MKKIAVKSNRTVLVLCLCLAFFAATITGCVIDNYRPFYSYSWENVTYTEPITGESREYIAITASTANADYYFDSLSYDTQNQQRARDAFIASAERFFNKAAHALPYINYKRLHIFVGDFYPRAVGHPDAAAGGVYVTPNMAESLEFSTLMLSAMMGTQLNYGLLYALSADIQKVIGFDMPAIKTTTEVKEFFSKGVNRYLLDMNYAVFDGKFSSFEQIEYAKSFAVRFCEYVLEKKQNPRELFAALTDITELDLAFDQAFYPLINDYLKFLDLSPINIPTTAVRFSSFTYQYPVTMHTLSCNYYINRDWEETTIQETIPFLNFEYNYLSLKNYLIEAEEPLKKIRDFFGYESELKAFVRLEEVEGGHEGYANMTDQKGLICMNSLFAIVHEYAHIITAYQYFYYNCWMVEGLANYCMFTFDTKLIAWEQYGYINSQNAQGDMAKRIYALYDATFSRFTVKNLLYTFAYVYHIEQGNEKHGQFYNHTSSAAFSAYLIDTYGREKYLALYESYLNYAENFEKTEAEVLQDYFDFLTGLFGE